MANFDDAVRTVLANEGGYVNNPSDPGGETKYGISHRAYPDEDIKNLTLDRAMFLYRRDYWRFDDVKDQTIATKLLDMAVNMGPGEQRKLLLQALAKIGANSVNTADPKKLLRALRWISAIHYVRLVVSNPRLGEFLNGWLWRAVQ